MSNNENLYITQEDLYRFGNSESSRISNVKPREITTMKINGINNIVANGNGVSLFNKAGLEATHLTGWVWEVKKNTHLPIGLNLVKDEEGSLGHYMLVPNHNMPLNQYIGLLEKMAMCCKKTQKKRA